MKRREILKNIGFTSLGMVGVSPQIQAAELLAPPKPAPKEIWNYGRTKKEKERDAKLFADKFFTETELKMVSVLADIILPADARSISASQSGVPAFIEFMMKDKPEMQTPMRGGLRWLDSQSLKRFNKKFLEISQKEKIEIIDDIAYPNNAKPEMSQGVNFFSMMRNLTATGFWTSKAGIVDIGYMGNVPNQWDGPPEDVIKQYGLEAFKS